MKTIERAHQPVKMWERVKLSKNYETALKQVSQGIIFQVWYVGNIYQ